MSGYFDDVERELRAAVRNHAHLPWYVRLRLRHSRAPIVVVAGLIVAGPALAAAGLFQSGSPVAPVVAPTRTAGDGVAISSSATLLALRTPDPTGGLPWGMRVLRTTRALVCIQVGRVDFGAVGALGRDDAFANDGRFHPFSENYEPGPPCLTPDGHGNGYLNVSESGVPASALLGGQSGSGESGCRPPRSLVGLPDRIRLIIGRRLRKLRGPVCPIADLRDVYYGLLGPDAVSITHETSSGGFVTSATSGPDGAYLIVLPHHPSVYSGGFDYGGGPPRGVISVVSYRDGRICHLPAANTPGGGCPPVGYVSPAGLLPSAANVAAHVTARLEIANSYCVKGALTEPCPAKTPPGFRRLAIQYEAHQGLVKISFTARVAVTNGHSYYYIQMCDLPPNARSRIPLWFKRLARKHFECYFGGSGGPTNADYKARTRITDYEFVDLRQRGVIHGDVSLVITTGPNPSTFSPAAKGQSIGRDVGHFTINVP